jgi:glycosyltransferase involved in cell wall biosynthesis
VKICVITCYKQPDYVRAKTLRAALGQIKGAEVAVVKNDTTGIMRYAQVMLRLLKARVRQKPDMYVLTFRGYEVLLPVRLLTAGKPLVYDEFINPIEWLAYEHKKISPKSPLTWLLRTFYRTLLKSVNLILTDTASHADLSAGLMKLDRGKFCVVPVGTDEATFEVAEPEYAEGDEFTVLYYGNMLPLHGLNYVIEAAVKLNHDPVKFILIGGNAKVAHDVAFAVGNGANIEYHAWVEFERLPLLMRSADLCLAGPFGGTFQSEYVITGKAYQYMALGRPMMIGENKESGTFRNKLEALIVPQADTDAIVEAVRWSMRNRNRLYAMGKKAQALYEREFSTNVLSARLEEGLRGAGLLELSASAERK